MTRGVHSAFHRQKLGGRVERRASFPQNLWLRRQRGGAVGLWFAFLWRLRSCRLSGEPNRRRVAARLSSRGCVGVVGGVSVRAA